MTMTNWVQLQALIFPFGLEVADLIQLGRRQRITLGSLPILSSKNDHLGQLSV